jgi:hypothetical protein
MNQFRLLVAYLFVLSLYSCDNSSKPTSNTESTNSYQPVNRSYTKTDTVRFKQDSTRMAVIGVMKGILQADSSNKVPVDVLYYVKGQQVSVYTDTFSTFEGEEELSHYFEAMDTLGNSCEQFFTVNYGYSACGYTQHKLTFSADQNNCYFIAHHESSADGAYGYGIAFYNICKETSPRQISSVIESNAPLETNENEIVIEYSDSTVYTFDGKKWTSKLVTPKEKVFRTIQEKF